MIIEMTMVNSADVAYDEQTYPRHMDRLFWFPNARMMGKLNFMNVVDYIFVLALNIIQIKWKQ